MRINELHPSVATRILADDDLDADLVACFREWTPVVARYSSYNVEAAALLHNSPSDGERCVVIMLPGLRSVDFPPGAAEPQAAVINPPPPYKRMACLLLRDGAIALPCHGYDYFDARTRGRLQVVYMFDDASILEMVPYPEWLEEDLSVCCMCAQSPNHPTFAEMVLEREADTVAPLESEERQVTVLVTRQISPGAALPGPDMTSIQALGRQIGRDDSSPLLDSVRRLFDHHRDVGVIVDRDALPTHLRLASFGRYVLVVDGSGHDLRSFGQQCDIRDWYTETRRFRTSSRGTSMHDFLSLENGTVLLDWGRLIQFVHKLRETLPILYLQAERDLLVNYPVPLLELKRQLDTIAPAPNGYESAMARLDQLDQLQKEAGGLTLREAGKNVPILNLTFVDLGHTASAFTLAQLDIREPAPFHGIEQPCSENMLDVSLREPLPQLLQSKTRS
ncbi:hypothetical protein SAMN05414139_03898 [Burkholderia sp. D7]|nr:hypothetical protein SAMN05414139_03898 [Burkholderia sp. D7]